MRLTLLGGAGLEGPDGPVRGRAAQRMRLAFLAILAAHRGGSVSRDRLTGLIWPDHGDDRARRLLSEALYVVRKELGEDVIDVVGDDLRLDPDALPSDLEEFRRALDADDFPAAAGAYGGPFLDGFFIDGSPEFEKWVDGERSELAAAYGTALRALAAAEDDPGAAVAWWRRLAAHERYDASVALGLMQALEAAGKRGEAIRHASVHAALLREELDAQPDPEVEALARRLREDPRAVGLSEAPAAETASPGAPRPEPDHAAPSMAPEIDEVHRSRSTPRGQRSESTPRGHAAAARRSWRVPPRVLIVAGLVAALSAAALWWRADSVRPLPGPVGEGTAVVVPPFSVQASGGQEAAFLAEGAATLLASAIDGAGGLRVVDERAVLSLAARRPELSAERIADRFGAAARVEGTVVATGDRLRIEARLVDSTDGEVTATASGEAHADSLFGLIDGLATQLLAARGADPLTGVAARNTASLDAFKAFMRGSEAFRATRYEEATEAFQRAVDVDPTYALAHYRLSAASQWAFDFPRARVAIRAAQRHATRLPVRERALVGAWAAFLEGDADRAEGEYEALVAQVPHDAEAWAGLGEVLVHYNPARGRPTEEAAEPFRRAVEIDPGVGEARFHLLEFAAARGDRVAFDTLFALVDPDSDQAAAWRAVRAAAWGDAAELADVRGQLASGDPIAFGVALGRIAANLGDLDAAASLGAMEDPPLDTPELAAAGRVMRAAIEAARGRPAAADRLLDEAAEAEPDWTREFRALFALLPSAPTDTTRLRAIRDDLLAWDPAQRVPSIGFFLGAHADVHAPLRAYLLGLVATRLGDISAAEASARELEAFGRSGESASLGRAWAASLRAHAAAARGDAEAATRHLSAARIDAPSERRMISPFFAGSIDRWLRGELAAADGDSEAALRWFGSLTDGYEFLYAAPAHRRMGELLEGDGRLAEARAHYRRFVDLWADAEAPLRPAVRVIRNKLGEPPRE